MRRIPPTIDNTAEGNASLLAAVFRVQSLCEGLSEAHDLGVEPGVMPSLVTAEAERVIVPEFTADLPDRYRRGVAEWFLEVANILLVLPAPPEVVAEWSTVEQFFRMTSVVLLDSLPDDAELLVVPRTPRPPAIGRYRALAALVSTGAVEELHHATVAVGAALKSWLGGPLTRPETLLLERLAAGEALVDAAAGVGLSRRTAYRVLSRLQQRFEVGSRSELIALAVGSGWITTSS